MRKPAQAGFFVGLPELMVDCAERLEAYSTCIFWRR
jgi:hypothetical protein